MPKFLAPIDLTQLELRNVAAQNLATPPGSPVEGQFYYDTSTSPGVLYYWNGTSWIATDGSSLNLSDLNDVDITAVADRDVLLYDSGSSKWENTDFDTEVRTSRLDQMAAPTGSVSLNSQKITSLLDPTSAQDAATKSYVDARAAGLDPKQSVQFATAAVLPDSPTYDNGVSGVGATLTAGANGALLVDGSSPSVNDRILVKDQATAANDGIYTVTATGDGSNPYVLTRATDFDSTTEVTGGAFTFVEGGSTNVNRGYVLSGTGAFTIGTTAITWVQFTGAGEITAGAGLTKSGDTLNVIGTTNRIDVAADAVDISTSYVGQASITTLGTITTGTWTGTTIAVANGGTGATTAAGAKTNLSFMTRYAAAFGDGASTSFNIDHNLNTRDVVVQVYDASSYVQVEVDVTHSTVNRVVLAFAAAPSTNAYRVVVIG